MVSANPPQKKKKNTDLDAVEEDAKRRSGNAFLRQFYSSPFWLIIFILLWIYVVVAISSEQDYTRAWNYVRGDFFAWIFDTLGCRILSVSACPEGYTVKPPPMDGIALTLFLALVAYVIAIVLGLLIGVVRANPPTPPNSRSTPWRWLRSVLYIVFYNALTFYVEFMRGIPSLVFVLLAGFAILPSIRDNLNTGLIPGLNNILGVTGIQIGELKIRGNDPFMGIAALSLIYAAYLSEVFRAGIQGIAKGQFEAARSLGMNGFQTMRLIVIPQAIRAVLPPLGNDFIAIIKDTALLTILGLNEITKLSQKWVGTSFTYPQTYLVLSMIYLTMTIIGSLLVQIMESRLRRHER